MLSPVRTLSLRVSLLASILYSLACGAPSLAVPESASSSVDQQLYEIIKLRGAAAPLASGIKRKTPAQDPLVKLGEILFFSKTLGGTFDSSCASCHHPELAGGDGLSLAVGIAAKDPDFLGPGRTVEPSLDNDPLKDGGPNVPRNSQTIINTSLYQRELFFDGRVERLRYAPRTAKPAIQITTPDSNNLADPYAGGTLLQAQARFPVTSADEMRNFLHPEFNSTWLFRSFLVERLKGNADAGYMRASAPKAWLKLFRAAYGANGSRDTLVTFENIQKAIAAYEESLVFVDTPFSRYLAGQNQALSEPAKQGALLFFNDKEQGGLGCYSCHSGNFFSDEKFYNVGIPQIGRGKRADGNDFGRWQVTKQDSDKYAYRTPSLINVTLTAPYGHTGTFGKLEDFLRYHVNPREQVKKFDFTLQNSAQFKGTNQNYPNALKYTVDAQAAGNFSNQLLDRDLDDTEVIKLKAFLDALSSECLSRSLKECLANWIPHTDEDPDGNLLVRASAPSPDSQRFSRSADSALKSVPYQYKIVTLKQVPLPSRGHSIPGPECRSIKTKGLHSQSVNSGFYFTEQTSQLGLAGLPGFSDRKGQKYDKAESSTDYQQLLPAGGVSASYAGDGCWPDLYYTSGNRAGAFVLRNNSGKGFLPPRPLIPANKMKGPFTSIGLVDLFGDSGQEVVLGNLRAGNVEILRDDEDGNYKTIAELPMERNTYGISFGDYNQDGYPDLYLGHWDYNGLPGTAPALWKNNAGVSLSPQDKMARLSVDFGINQNWQFTPSFADVDGDNRPDILLASDFNSSTVLHNEGDGKYTNVTDRKVINDENGMGSAVADFRNSGMLDWFVGAIFDITGQAEGNWGVHGNRMYRNESTPGKIRFRDVTDQANVRNGLWSWGTCAADFNNDGWLDILQVNGYGVTPPGLDQSKQTQDVVQKLNQKLAQFAGKAARLFINQGDGTFREQAQAWQIDGSIDGRGLVCFDYDHDGDIDAAILDRSKGLRLFENQSANANSLQMLFIRLFGKTPNTAALGAKVYVTADLNGDGNIENNETQLRVANANSNFNSQNPPDLHFGLGRASSAQSIKIVWPSGTVQEFHDIPGNQFLFYRE